MDGGRVDRPITPSLSVGEEKARAAAMTVHR